MELLSLSPRQRQLLVATVAPAVGGVALREDLEVQGIRHQLPHLKEIMAEQDIQAGNLPTAAVVVEQVLPVKVILNSLLAVTVRLRLFLARL